MTKSEKKKMCHGCRNDFYNGNNNLGVAECWNFPSSKIVKMKKVGMWDVPPWEHQPVEKVLSCRHESGYVFIEPHRKF